MTRKQILTIISQIYHGQNAILLKVLSCSMLVIILTSCGVGDDEKVTSTTSRDCGGPDPYSSALPAGPMIWHEKQFDVAVEKDVVYAKALTHSSWRSDDATEMDLLLDLYQPVGAPGNRPALILIHGGAYFKGSKEHGKIVSLARHFVERGFVAIAINYRLTDAKGTIPDIWKNAGDLLSIIPGSTDDIMKTVYPAARDAKAATRWLHAHRDELGINPDYVSALGASAGAQLAVALGATEPEDFRDELDNQQDWTLNTTHLESPSQVRTVVDLWGSGIVVDSLTALFLKKIRWDRNDANLLMIHGTLDNVVPYFEAKRLQASYCAARAPFVFYSFHGQGHGVWNGMVKDKNIMQLSFDFIQRTQNLQIQ